MRILLGCCLLMLAGCGGSLPPAQPILGAAPPGSETAPAAGTYRFLELEPRNLWILSQSASDADAAMIQLDGIDLPRQHADGSDAPELREAAGTVIREILTASKKFRFVPTYCAYAPPGEVGGVIYLAGGHTLQDVLLSQGMARVDREKRYIAAELAPALLAYWQACEDRAKAARAGFWGNNAEAMKRRWDEPRE